MVFQWVTSVAIIHSPEELTSSIACVEKVYHSFQRNWKMPPNPLSISLWARNARKSSDCSVIL